MAWTPVVDLTGPQGLQGAQGIQGPQGVEGPQGPAGASIRPPVTLTDATTVATDASTSDTFRLTMAGNRTLAAPSNPTDGQRAVWAVTASGGARTLSLATGTGGFAFGGDLTELTATVSGTTDYLGAIFNAAAARWHLLAYSKGF